MSLKIGKAKFGSQNNPQRKYFKLKDGEQAYRILPPLGELADQGRWAVFHSVHYGYKTSDGKQKPFLSCEVKNRKNGTVEVADAAKERIMSLKAKFEEAKKSGNKAVADKLEKLVGSQGMYNLDNNHYMNVLDSQGNIGILKIRHKAKLALEAEIKKLNHEGIDPLSIENGRFFVFTRSGMGRDTTYGVSVLKEKMKVEKLGVVERDVVHTLDEETLNRLENEAEELNKIFRSLTAQEIAEVVEKSDIYTGVSPVLDKIFNKVALSQEDSDAAAADAEEQVEVEEFTTTFASPGTVNVTSVTKPATITPKAAVTDKVPNADITQLDHEEFLKRLEQGTL